MFILLLVQETLYTLIQEKGGPGVKTNGLFEQMSKVSFFFGLKLGHLIFSATEKLSRIIQSSSCSLQDVLCAAEAVIHHFQRIGGEISYEIPRAFILFDLIFFSDDNNFKSFYDGVINESKGLTDEPILSRYRKPPKRYDSNSIFVNFTSWEEFYRQQYIESLEIVVNMLQNRFTQKNFKLLYNVEEFIVSIANHPLDDSVDYLQTILDFCHGDIDMGRLKAEATMICDFV